MKMLIIAASTVLSTSAFAETKSGTIDVAYAHEHFSYVVMRGEAAQLVYEKMQAQEKESKTGMGTLVGLSKTAADGRMVCTKKVAGDYDCMQAIDSSTGELIQVWNPNK